jgi:hypothetical protein
VLGELDSFGWPAPDLRPILGEGLQSVAIGLLPATLSNLIDERPQTRIRPRRLAITIRTGAE